MTDLLLKELIADMGEVDNFKKKVEEGEVATITLLLDNGL